VRSGNTDSTSAAPAVINTTSADCSAEVLPGDAARRVGAAATISPRSRHDLAAAHIPSRWGAALSSGLAGAFEIPMRRAASARGSTPRAHSA
jgi:hypothetical protein